MLHRGGQGLPPPNARDLPAERAGSGCRAGFKGTSDGGSGEGLILAEQHTEAG